MSFTGIGHRYLFSTGKLNQCSFHSPGEDDRIPDSAQQICLESVLDPFDLSSLISFSKDCLVFSSVMRIAVFGGNFSSASWRMRFNLVRNISRSSSALFSVPFNVANSAELFTFSKEELERSACNCRRFVSFCKRSFSISKAESLELIVFTSWEPWDACKRPICISFSLRDFFNLSNSSFSDFKRFSEVPKEAKEAKELRFSVTISERIWSCSSPAAKNGNKQNLVAIKPIFVERKTRKKKLGGTATQTNYAGIDEYAIPAPWLDLRAREITFGNSKDD
uniref:Uncharacterized protein n=1 Tax=Glossina pallidipes TaxID=7398 RepID=A0A1A9Z428_GLOPL